jgi:flagellar assembly factor FliW
MEAAAPPMTTETITLESSRFGTVEVPAEAVVEFPTGLIGLGGHRYALLARNEESTFVWLHSLEDPELALPLTNPWQFFNTYEVELSDDEADRIGVNDAEETVVYVTVRAAETLEDFSANLRAPILIANGNGHQVINQAPDAPVRAPLFAGTTEAAA